MRKPLIFLEKHPAERAVRPLCAFPPVSVKPSSHALSPLPSSIQYWETLCTPRGFPPFPQARHGAFWRGWCAIDCPSPLKLPSSLKLRRDKSPWPTDAASASSGRFDGHEQVWLVCKPPPNPPRTEAKRGWYADRPRIHPAQGGVMCRDVSGVVTPRAYARGSKKLSPPRRLKVRRAYRRGGAGWIFFGGFSAGAWRFPCCL